MRIKEEYVYTLIKIGAFVLAVIVGLFLAMKMDEGAKQSAMERKLAEPPEQKLAEKVLGISHATLEVVCLEGVSYYLLIKQAMGNAASLAVKYDTSGNVGLCSDNNI